MKKRWIASVAALLLLCENVAFAEDYWTKANDNIQTGIGGQGSSEIELISIDELINKGWSADFAPKEEKKTEYVSAYQKEIKLAVDLGFMDENEDGFRPQEKLSYYDYLKAVKLLSQMSSVDISGLERVQNTVTFSKTAEAMVYVLGYDKLADPKDEGFFALAQNYKIFDNIPASENDEITREEFAKVISNALESEVVTVKMANSLEYVIDGTTLMEQLKIAKVRGWLNANSRTNIYSVNKATENTVMIDNVEYGTGESDAYGYLGRFVEAYVREDDSGDKTVASIRIYSTKDNYITIYDEDVEETSKSNIKYVDSSEKVKTLKLSADGSVIYNGAFAGALSAFDVSGLKNSLNGYISAADTDFDGKYDVLFVWNYKTYVVEMVSGERIVARNNEILDFSDERKDILLLQDGQTTAISDIASNNVLSVAENQKGDMITVLVSNKNFTGSYSSAGSEILVDGDGNEYKIDPFFSDEIGLGKEYTFYMSVFGKIAGASEYTTAATKTRTGRNYGYFRKAYLDDVDENAANFRIYRLSDKTWVTLEGADKIKFYKGFVDSETTEDKKVEKKKVSASEAADLLGKPQLIVFETDAYGKVSSITTASDYTATGNLDENVFAYNSHIEDRVRTYYGGFFGGRYHNENCIILRVPADREQEKNYGVESMPSDGFVDGPMDIYDVSETLTLGGVIVRYSEAGGSVNEGNVVLITVDKVEQCVVDDEILYKILTVEGKTYYISNDAEFGEVSMVKDANSNPMWHVKKASDLKRGDVMRIKVDSLGYITNFSVDTRISELADMDFFSYNSGGEIAQYYYDYGMVIRNSVLDKNLVLNTSGTTNPLYNTPKLIENVMLLYNTKTGKFEKLDNKNDILPGDKLFVRSRYYLMDITAIVIR